MRARALLLGLPLLLLATACGGGEGEATGSAPSVSPGDDGGADSSTSPASYLAVPDGVTLTDPGSSLPLKQSAIAAWAPRQDLVGVVQVKVNSIEETTGKQAFVDYAVDGATKRSAVFYVHVRATNVGDTDLGARDLPLVAVEDNGAMVEATAFANSFEACPDATLPVVFDPGSTVGSCLVFLVPQGSTLTSVEFRPPEGVEPIVWTGDATPLGGASQDGGAGKHHKNGKHGRKGTKAKQREQATS